MPGTVVRDALETDLLSAATLDSATSSNGTALEIGWPGQVQFVLETGTVTGTSPTLTIEIQGSENSDFSTENVVTLGTITAGDDDDAEHGLTTYVDAKYVRASVVTGGTSPDYSGTTLKVVQPHYNRVRGTTPTSEVLS